MTVDARQPEEDRCASGFPDMDARGVRSLLVIACVFAIVGGYTDAYSYLAHGHVFANAQTGNVVFVGVYASGGEWGQAARHLPPIAAFVLGVATANLLGVKSQKREFRATLLCQGFELAILLALIGAGSRLPDEWIVPAISFVAAIQTSCLDTIGAWSFYDNSGSAALLSEGIRESRAYSGVTLQKRPIYGHRVDPAAVVNQQGAGPGPGPPVDPRHRQQSRASVCWPRQAGRGGADVPASARRV